MKKTINPIDASVLNVLPYLRESDSGLRTRLVALLKDGDSKKVAKVFFNPGVSESDPGVKAVAAALKSRQRSKRGHRVKTP